MDTTCISLSFIIFILPHVSFIVFVSYSIPRFKQRFSFVTPEYGNLYALLDAAKVADTVLLLPSLENGVDEFGDYCLSCLFAQGLPSTILACKVST